MRPWVLILRFQEYTLQLQVEFILSLHNRISDPDADMADTANHSYEVRSISKLGVALLADGYQLRRRKRVGSQ